MTVQSIITGVDEKSDMEPNGSVSYAGTNGLGPTGATTSGHSVIDQYSPNETLGANAGAPQRTRVTLTEGRKVANGGLDKSLLKRAESIIDSFNPDNVVEVTVNIEALQGIFLQLWESAIASTQFHREILAALESAILSIESLNKSQLSVFREAIVDLKNDVLTQAHVDVICRQFIAQGFSPLALLSEIEDGDDRN